MNANSKQQEFLVHRKRVLWVVGVSLALFALVWLVPQAHGFKVAQYAGVHAAMEMFAVVVALATFGVIWSAWTLQRSSDLMVIALGFLAVGLLDIGHAVTFPGMPYFFGQSGTDKTIYFWFLARWAAVLTLLYGALRPRFVVASNAARHILLSAVLGLVALSYWGFLAQDAAFPAMYVEGAGLTPLKVGIEYALVAAFAVTALLYYRWARAAREIMPLYLAAAAAVSMLSEACFSSYASVADTFNILGHGFKVTAYVLIYRAIFVEAVRQPFLRAQNAEAEVNALEKNLRLAVNAAQIGFWDWDIGAQRVYYSPEWKRQLGYADAELSNRLEEWESRLHPEDRERALDYLRTFLANPGAVYESEVRLRHRDGGYRHILSRADVLCNAQGQAMRMVGAHIDLTERRQTEQALQASQNRLQAIIESTPVPFAVNDALGNITYLNPKFVRTFGYTLADIPTLAAWWPRAYPDPAYRAWVQATWTSATDKALREGLEVEPIEVNIACKDGTQRTVLASPAQMDEAHLVFLYDITERKLAEQALRDNQAMLNKAQEIALLGSWELDVVENRLFWSDEVYRIFGLRPREFAASYEAFLARVHPDDRAAVDAAYSNSVRDGLDSYEIEHRIVRANSGEVRFVHEKCEHARDASGRIVRSLGMVHDITERVLLQKQALQAQKMQAIGQLSGGIAHDFNNILASILGYTDLALERFVPDKESKLAGYLNEIKRASERARDLIAKMLAFSRGGKGEVQTVAAAPLVTEVVQLLRSVVPSDIELKTAIASDAILLSIDPVHLHQMLMNLCINARDAVGAHGHIEVGLAGNAHIDTVCASCQHAVQGEFVEIWVRDDGCGISSEALAHVFEPFFSTKEVGRGAGMGLSTVHGLVHGYGGHIVLTSAAGSGTTVRLLLPAAGALSGTAPSAAPKLALNTVDRGGATIMVVDDELALAHMLGELLENHGYAVQVFGDSQAALANFQANPARYAALITDFTMPGLNGLELVQALRALRADLPVLMCSGYSEKINVDTLESQGVSRFFVKPVTNQALVQAVDRLLGAPR